MRALFHESGQEDRENLSVNPLEEPPNRERLIGTKTGQDMKGAEVVSGFPYFSAPTERRASRANVGALTQMRFQRAMTSVAQVPRRWPQGRRQRPSEVAKMTVLGLARCDLVTDPSPSRRIEMHTLGLCRETGGRVAFRV